MRNASILIYQNAVCTLTNLTTRNPSLTFPTLSPSDGGRRPPPLKEAS